MILEKIIISLMVLGTISSVLVFGVLIGFNINKPEHTLTLPGWKHGKVLCNQGVIQVDIGYQYESEMVSLLLMGDDCNVERK